MTGEARAYVHDKWFVARVGGERALAFLHDTTSQDVATLSVGSSALTCVLSEKGRVLAELRLLVLAPDEVLIDGPLASRAAVAEWLARIAPLSGCEIVEEPMVCTAIRGPVAPPDDIDGLAVPVEWGGPGYDVLAQDARADGATAMTGTEFEAIRISAGRPLFGVDVTDALHIAETPLLARAVSPTKGCYPGQESVARVVNLGRPRRALALLNLDGEAPEPGTAVFRDSVDIGRVTSAAPANGGAVALALVSTDALPASAVEVGAMRGELRALD